MDRFLFSGCLNDRIDLLHMIGSLAGGATSSLVAKNWSKKLSQLFEKQLGSNLKFKLIVPKSITETYIDAKLGRYGLAGKHLVAILDFQMSIF